MAGFQFDLQWTNPETLTFVTVAKFREIFGELGVGQQPNPPDQANGVYRNVKATRIGESGVSGGGVLLSVLFRAKAVGSCTIQLRNLILSDSQQNPIRCDIYPAVVFVENPVNPWDVNHDGAVNIFDLSIVGRYLGQPAPVGLDIFPDVNGDGVVNLEDFTLVGSHFGESYAPNAPAQIDPERSMLNPTLRKQLERIYVNLLSAVNDSPAHRRAIEVLRRLLFSSAPDHNSLLQNYPNPFNPETWMPFHIADASRVSIEIYNVKGDGIRRLDLGYRLPGRYESRGDAAYWDGRDERGEPVSSGVFFYTLIANSFRATKKMVVVK
jgi:hypothetical protein